MAIEQLMTESRVAMDGGINRLYQYTFQMLAAPLILMAIFLIVVMVVDPHHRQPAPRHQGEAAGAAPLGSVDTRVYQIFARSPR